MSSRATDATQNSVHEISEGREGKMTPGSKGICSAGSDLGVELGDMGETNPHLAAGSQEERVLPLYTQQLRMSLTCSALRKRQEL